MSLFRGFKNSSLDKPVLFHQVGNRHPALISASSSFAFMVFLAIGSRPLRRSHVCNISQELIK